jgi:hypothetical protein
MARVAEGLHPLAQTPVVVAEVARVEGENQSTQRQRRGLVLIADGQGRCQVDGGTHTDLQGSLSNSELKIIAGTGPLHDKRSIKSKT